jgi:hypothetical protein
MLKITSFFESHEFRLWWRWSVLLVVAHLVTILTFGGVAIPPFIFHESVYWNLLVFPIFLMGRRLIALYCPWDQDNSFYQILIVWLILTLVFGLVNGTAFLGIILGVVAAFSAVIVAFVWSVMWIINKVGSKIVFKKPTPPDFVKKAIDFMYDR